jgi:hypothetical protein
MAMTVARRLSSYTDGRGRPVLDAAFRPESWVVLYAAIAGASAALTGLLFVAFSINLRQIADNR